MQPPLHIGIVGCSAEGAALCYRTVCAEGERLLGEHAHPEVSLHNTSLAQYVECLARNDLGGVAGLMLDSARKLAAAGADFLICPDNTIHQAFPLLIDRSPLPWLHIATVVAEEAAVRGFSRVGLLGTTWLVSSDVYPTALARHGIECVRPTESERKEVGRLIMEDLVHAVFKAETVSYLQATIERLALRGCQAVVLGCTEIPLIIGDHNSSVPTLDSTRLLARAAVSKAISPTGGA